MDSLSFSIKKVKSGFLFRAETFLHLYDQRVDLQSVNNHREIKIRAYSVQDTHQLIISY